MLKTISVLFCLTCIGCSDTISGYAYSVNESEIVYITYHYPQCWDSLTIQQETKYIDSLNSELHYIIKEIVRLRQRVPATESCYSVYRCMVVTDNLEKTIVRMQHWFFLNVSIDVRVSI